MPKTANQKPSSDTLPFDVRTSSRIRRKLLDWFDRHKRDLPWRRTTDPYAIWISETMLQQTQVATVTAYYKQFMARFPTIDSLAAAKADVVMRTWAGLGYYARARNLHRAAKKIVTDWDGAIPETVEDLLTLPGVGPYTAGAVASIAHNKKTPAVDGNVIRVFARLFEIDADMREGAGRTRAWEIAARLLPRRRFGDFNQALMELGATVCLPGHNARCEDCPLHSECGAYAAKTVAGLPVKRRKTRVQCETHVVAAIEHDNRWLILRRPKPGLWGGLWELPTIIPNSESSPAAARRLAGELLGYPMAVARQPFCIFKHQLSHRTVTFIGHRCHPDDTPRKGHNKKKTSNPIQWATLKQLRNRGISAAMRHVIDALQASARQSKPKVP